MATIKPLSEIRDKWQRVAPTRLEDYESGVKNPRSDWATETAKANDRYKDAVIKAANAGRFAAGVKKAGTSKWQERAVSVGPGRWSEGVSVAGPEFEKGFGPYHDVIAKTVLPNKYPKGDVRNIDRVKAIANALHAKKISG